MTITEIVDFITTEYEAGNVQGIVASVLKTNNSLENLWCIHDKTPNKFLISVGMADTLKQDIHLEAAVKDDCLKMEDGE